MVRCLRETETHRLDRELTINRGEYDDKEHNAIACDGYITRRLHHQ